MTRVELAEKLDINASTLWRNLNAGTNRRFLLAVASITGIPMSLLESPMEEAAPCKRKRVVRTKKPA